MGALKSKTIWFSIALAVLGVVEMQLGQFQQYMPPWGYGLLTIGISVCVAVLRVVTTQPLSEK